MGILPPMECLKIAAVQERMTAAGEQKMLWVAHRKVNARKTNLIMAVDERLVTGIRIAMAV
jgi:hypothetical protein